MFLVDHSHPAAQGRKGQRKKEINRERQKMGKGSNEGTGLWVNW